jgi:hypothetical protein
VLSEVTVGGCARSPESVLRPSAEQISERHSRPGGTIADGVIPCQCVLHEDAVVGPTGADCVCVGYLKRAFRVGEEVTEGGKSFADCMRQAETTRVRRAMRSRPLL